jgi:hypothetical protein
VRSLHYEQIAKRYCCQPDLGERLFTGLQVRSLHYEQITKHHYSQPDLEETCLLIVMDSIS